MARCAEEDGVIWRVQRDGDGRIRECMCNYALSHGMQQGVRRAVLLNGAADGNSDECFPDVDLHAESRQNGVCVWWMDMAALEGVRRTHDVDGGVGGGADTDLDGGRGRKGGQCGGGGQMQKAVEVGGRDGRAVIGAGESQRLREDGE